MNSCINFIIFQMLHQEYCLTIPKKSRITFPTDGAVCLFCCNFHAEFWVENNVFVNVKFIFIQEIRHHFQLYVTDKINSWTFSDEIIMLQKYTVNSRFSLCYSIKFLQQLQTIDPYTTWQWKDSPYLLINSLYFRNQPASVLRWKRSNKYLRSRLRRFDTIAYKWNPVFLAKPYELLRKYSLIYSRKFSLI